MGYVWSRSIDFAVLVLGVLQIALVDLVINLSSTSLHVNLFRLTCGHSLWFFRHAFLGVFGLSRPCSLERLHCFGFSRSIFRKWFGGKCILSALYRLGSGRRCDFPLLFLL